ncbi:hypothetical protein ACWNS2_10180 [Planococcus plakortidis]
MENLYGVHAGSSTFVIVKANSEQEALDVFAKSQINDELLREEIDSFIVNSSLLEKFYKDEHGHFLEDFTGDYNQRLLNMNDVDRENYIQFHIEKNVREFWKDTPEHAESYLKAIKEYTEINAETLPSFSEEFYIETIKLIIRDGKWFGDFGIVKIELSEKDYQVIYEE